jgi:alkanesulfonate monooxygenase SsuD/methylene tetrahydromethanopterin reductase-like flavin-dependent oxidoreductase (luciferase family)
LGAYRRIGRFGDGWIPHAITLEEAKAGLARIRECRREAGRADAPLTAVVPLKDVFTPDGYERAEDAGVTHVLTAPWLMYGGSHRSLENKRNGLRRFANEVIGKLR